MRTCPDCPHEPHPGIVCGGLLAGGQCFCQAPPCQHPGFAAVREFGGIGGIGPVVGYVCVDCHGPFEVEEVERGRLFTVADEIRDREAFRALLAGLGIDSHVTADGAGGSTIALDRAGMEQLRDWFADQGDAAQADAIQRAFDG